MVSRKEIAARDPSVVPMQGGPPPIARSRLPKPLRFPVLAVASLSLSTFLYSLASPYVGGELASVSRSLNEGWQLGAIVTWKVIELGIGWFGGYDDVDIAALAILSHVPHLYFLTVFYAVSLRTTALALVINILSISLPTRLLRPRSAAHAPATTSSLVIPNRPLIADLPIRISTSALAASIYGVWLFASQRLWLPVFLVRHFDGLRTLEHAHATLLPVLVVAMAPVGWAAREFLLFPTIAAKGSSSSNHHHPSADHHDDASSDDDAPPTKGKGKRKAVASKRTGAPAPEAVAQLFDPETASLAETLRHNVWGWEDHTKVLISRTAAALVFSGLNVAVQTFTAVEGADKTGAAGWAAVWASAAVLTAVVFRWVGDV